MAVELTTTIKDPDAFAKELYGELAADCDPASPVCGFAKPEFAAYEAALGALKAGEAPDEHRLAALDEAVMGLAHASHEAGIRFGVSTEALRRRLLGEARPGD
jgi:hypothetical protein